MKMRPSRAMIPGELSWAYIALALAWAGGIAWPLEPGSLYRALQHGGQNAVWTIVVGAPALGLITMSAREWTICCLQQLGARVALTDEQLYRSVLWRGRFCLALVMSWLYVLYLGVQHPKTASAITVIAAGAAFFCWGFYKENRRVQRELRQSRKSAPLPAAV